MAEKKIFTSKLVRTSNVAQELLLVAKEYDISIHTLDFNLIKTEVYVKESSDKEEGEFHEASEDELKHFQDPEGQANKGLSIKQIYDVDIFLLETPMFPKLEMGIAANKTLTAVYATIKAGSVINKTDHILLDLGAYFNRRKLRTHILIDIWDDEMIAELTRLSAQVEVNDSVSFEEDKRILVSKSLLANPTINDKLILHFEAKEQSTDDQDRVDYKKRGFITSVEENELLITYMKPQTGTPGRNCRGQFIEVPEADGSHLPTFEIDEESIEIKEDEKKIEYFAKRNGYIDVDGSKYYIKEALEVSEISFKSTGNVKAGLNTDIMIKVSESDAMSDAIGMGVEVEATEIDVEGNVGSNSTVTAKSIRIGGQTHQTSTLIAPKINVNLHRGTAKGDDVEIKRLEQGTVIANTVRIQEAAGGEVIGKNIIIDILQSHVKVVASESIIIKKMRGSENLLIIDQTKVGANPDAVNALEAEIDEKRIEINVARKALDVDKELIEEHRPAIEDIKARLIAYKKAGAKLPAAFVTKYKEFQQLHNKMLADEKAYHLMQDMFAIMEQRRGSFQTSALEAQVVNYDIWKGHNEVRFHLTSPAQELPFFPKEGLKSSAIMLKYDKKNDAYSVVSVSSDIPGV